jgi:hypothetical protein
VYTFPKPFINRFTIIIPSTSRFFYQNSEYISLLPFTCYMPCPSHPPPLNPSNNI